MSLARSNVTDSIENKTLPEIPDLEEPAHELSKRSDDTSKQYMTTIFNKKSVGDLTNLSSEDDECISLPDINNYKTKTNVSSSNRYNASYIASHVSEGTSEKSEAQSIHLPRLQPPEATFLQLVAIDDVNGVNKYLGLYPRLNINCENFQGITALHLAVQNRSEKMVEFLLRRPDIDVGDTVLHAIKDNSMRILVMLLDARKRVCPGLEFAGVTHSPDFPEHVTPLMLAARLGHYETTALLIARGHTLPHPHSTGCICIKCRNSLVKDDPLYSSTARLAVYQAISSPAYIVHVSSDPILAAFRLTTELEENAKVYIHLATAYMHLVDAVSVFAVELIGCCRTSEEVELLLKQTAGAMGRRQFVLPRLLMAVEYKQREFVAHPNTQQVLESYWIGDWHNWRFKSSYWKVCTIVLRVFITPFILLMCMIAPRSSLVRHWQIPLNKLITHAGAYFVFLGLVFHISNRDKSAQRRGPPDTGAEFPLVLYVCGYTWSAIRMCLMQGPRRYLGEMWNWVEIIMLLLFGLTFGLWLDSAYDVIYNYNARERKYWDQYDPTLLAEGTFCLATIFAYLRLMLFCQLNYHLGPLQVSLGKMAVDIYRYLAVFAIIISAFAAGLARFYQYYDGMVYEDEYGMKTMQVSSFTSLRDTFNTLFWALFCMAPLESADVVLENTRDISVEDRYKENSHKFTERIGYFCFACFEVISVIVVLNMLIATMSNTFQRVNNNVAIEWTFGRTQVYVDYIWQTTLPSPYNMIPTSSALCSVCEWLCMRLCPQPGVRASWSPYYCCYVERDLEANVQLEYSALMSVLVQRYFRDKKSALSEGKTLSADLECLHNELATLKTFFSKTGHE